jgi:hypothetical protein
MMNIQGSKKRADADNHGCDIWINKLTVPSEKILMIETGTSGSLIYGGDRMRSHWNT